MNKVMLIGRLTKDPEVRYSGDSAVARYSLAVDRRFKNDEGPSADFISCVAFGNNARFVEKYLRKGIKIGAVGRIQTGSYTNRDGQKVYTTDVIVDEHEFVESKKSDQSEQVPVSSPMSGEDNGFMQVPDWVQDEELPFG